MKKIISLGVFLSCLLFATNVYSISSFLEARAIAEAEMKAWQAYYNKDSVELVEHLDKMLRLLYHLPDEEVSKRVARRFTAAADLFSELHTHTDQTVYNQEILPLIVVAYKELKGAVGGEVGSCCCCGERTCMVDCPQEKAGRGF